MTSRNKSILKYLLAIVLLTLVLHNTNLSKITSYLEQVSALNLAFALVLVSLAQITAALRMRYFFHASGFHLGVKFAVILYYVGSFYNFLLPGGIGGDAYKVMLMRKRLHMTTMQGIKIMVADRASGLCIVMLILFASLYLMRLSAIIPYANLLIAAAIVTTITAYLFLSQLLLGQSPRTMLLSLHYSLYSQLLWVATLYVLLGALGNGVHFIEYVALYCAASIAALIPVSVGGLGLKESAYFYGAMLIRDHAHVMVDGELGIVLSLCLFTLTLIACLPGILWLHKIGDTNLLHHHPEHAEQNV